MVQAVWRKPNQAAPGQVPAHRAQLWSSSAPADVLPTKARETAEDPALAEGNFVEHQSHVSWPEGSETGPLPREQLKGRGGAEETSVVGTSTPASANITPPGQAGTPDHCKARI